MKWAEDATPPLNGTDTVFTSAVIHTDSIYQELYKEVDEELVYLTKRSQTKKAESTRRDSISPTR